MVLSPDDQNLLALVTRELCTYIENMEEARWVEIVIVNNIEHQEINMVGYLWTM